MGGFFDGKAMGLLAAHWCAYAMRTGASSLSLPLTFKTKKSLRKGGLFVIGEKQWD